MRIVIFTGPTGGHFYPALAFAQAFKEKHPEGALLFVTSQRGRPLTQKAGARLDARFESLPDFPFPNVRLVDFIVGFPSFLLKLAQAFYKTGKIFEEFKPDLTVGFGSYASGPAILWSRWRKTPSLMHEQNRTMGQSNTWALGFVDRAALSFEPDEHPIQNPKIMVTGLPLRRALVDRALAPSASRARLFGTDRFRLLILGGSQGSRALNRLWGACFSGLPREEKMKLAVIHITGAQDYENTKAMYLADGVEAQVFSFHDGMEELFPQADLAITRAGAGTLFELALFGLPSVVVPYPHAGGHQDSNARYFESKGGVVRIPEAEATGERLAREIMTLMKTPVLREQMSNHLRKLARPEAAGMLVEAAEALIP